MFYVAEAVLYSAEDVGTAVERSRLFLAAARELLAAEEGAQRRREVDLGQ